MGSLKNLYPKNFIIPIALLAATVLLILGLILPVMTLKELVFWKKTFSVLTGIQNLFLEEHYILAVIILLFSVAFPIFKLTTLTTLWFFEMPEVRRQTLVHWLSALGKWSMLDVFVVAVMIVITKISGLASAEPRVGIYLFGLSVAITMVVTETIERLLKRSEQSVLGVAENG